MSIDIARTPRRSIWITGLIATRRKIEISNLYGEFACDWKSILFVSAVEFRSRGEESTILLLLFIEGYEDLFYIDMKKLNEIQFLFGESSTRDKVDSQLAGLLEDPLKVDLRKLLAFAAGRISPHLSKGCVDPTLTAFLQDTSLALPVFTTMFEIADYCRRTHEETAASRSLAETEGEQEDDELRFVARPQIDRKEWEEGAMIADRFLVQKVHKGGMGVVYEILDVKEVKYTAWKTWQERFLWDTKIKKRFINEAEIWVKLDRHPHIVNAELVRIIEGRPYICTEYVHGTDLEEIIQKGDLPVRRAMEFAIQICSGMDYAYRKLGLIHRDIKPSNCLITREGVLKITDFGLGRIFEDIADEADEQSVVDPSSIKSIEDYAAANPSITVTTVEGTILFMAPELFSRSRVSQQTDVYAFGLLLYMMLTGKNPMHAEKTTEIIENHLHRTPQSPHELNRDIPPGLGGLVLKCIDKSPDGRFESFSQIMERLEKIYEATFGVHYVMPESDDRFTAADWLNKGMSLASIDRHNEALLAYEQALKQDGGLMAAQIKKSDSLIHLGRYQDALQVLSALVKGDSTTHEAWFWMGEACRMAKEFDRALVCFDRALALSGDDADILIHKARVFTERGEYEKALALLDKSVQSKPRSEKAWFEKGLLLMQMDLNDAASECFLKTIDIYPDHKEAWISRGEALYKLGFFKEAIESYKKTLSIDERSIRARVGIGSAFREMGNYDRAVNSFDAAIAVEPANPAGYVAKAQLLMRTEKWESALEGLKQAQENGVKSQEISILRARCLLELGYHDDALDMLKDLTHEPEETELLLESASAWKTEKRNFLQGILANQKLKPEEIFTDLDTTLMIFCDPLDAALLLSRYSAGKETVQLLNILAALYVVAGRLDDAGECIRKSLERDESNRETLYLEQRIGFYLESREREWKRREFLRPFFRKILMKGTEKASPKSRTQASGPMRFVSKGLHDALFGIAVAIERMCIETEDAQERMVNFVANMVEAVKVRLRKKFHFLRSRLKTKKEGEKPRGWSDKTYVDWLALSMREFERGYYMKAIWLLEKVARSNPACHARLFYAARSYEAQGEEKTAAEYYEKFCACCADSPGYLKHTLIGGYGAQAASKEHLLRYEKWIGFYPENLQAWVMYARYLEKNGHYDRARLAVLSILERFSREDFKVWDLSYGLNVQGILNLQLGRVGAARGLFEEVLKEDERNETALVALARCSEAEGNITRARISYEKLVHDQIAPLTSSYLLASLLLSHGNVTDAMKPMDHALTKKPHSPLLSFKKGQALIARRKVMVFFLLISDIEGYENEFFSLRQLKSIAMTHTGKIDEAIADFEEARSVASTDHRVLKWLAVLYLKRSQYEKSSQVCHELLSLYPFDAASLLLNAITHYYLEQFEEAFSLFRQSLKLKPNSHEIMLFMAVLKLYQSGKGDDYSLFRKAQRLASDFAPVWLNFGIFYMKQKKYAQALQYFEGILRFDPDNSLAWLLRGLCQESLGELADAYKSAERTTCISPDDPDAWAFKGTLEYREKEYRKSVESFGTAARIDGGNWRHHYNLGLLHLLKGDNQAALEAFRKSTGLNPAYFESWMGSYLALKRLERDDNPDFLVPPEEGDETAFFESIIDKDGAETGMSRAVDSMSAILAAAKALDPRKFEQWGCRDPGGDLHSLGMEIVIAYDVPFAFTFDIFEHVFDPFTLFHLLECDRAFE